MSQEEINTAKKVLENYLAEKQYRNIPKRYVILEQIYLYNGHFSVDELYNYMLDNGQKVSRATLYNVMDLFLDAGLIIKHQFLEGLSVYEKALNKKTHHHYVCTQCGRIQEFRDEGVIRTAIQTKRIAKFKQTSYSLCIYGICSACSKKVTVK